MKHRYHKLLAIGMLLVAIPLGVIQNSSASQTSLTLPDSPAVDQLTWVLDEVNTGGVDLSPLRVERHFTDTFRIGLPTDQIIGVLQNYVAPAAPMSIARFEGGVTENRANALLETPTGLWRVQLAVEPAEPHRIDTLFFEPVYSTTPLDPPANWSELKRRVADIAPRSGFVAAEITDGSCDPIARVNVDTPLPIASAFKIYVLGELARQIESGDVAWSDLVTLRTDLISLPNGELRYHLPGERYSVEYIAEQMMANSDNTATDHLIDLLGRENVEQAMAAMGHEHVLQNTPLLMTREWFAIRMRFTDDEIASYVSADDEEQRDILGSDVAPIADTLAEWEPWPAFRSVSTIEWFASAGDLCRGMVALKESGVRHGLEPVLNALSLEPGIPFDPNDWAYVGYKGGYETGVHSNVWLLQRTDGRWFVLAGIINNPVAEIDGIGLTQLMQTAGDLLADVA